MSATVDAVMSAFSRISDLTSVWGMLTQLPDMFSSLANPVRQVSDIFGLFGTMFGNTSANMEKTRATTQSLTHTTQSLSAAWTEAANAVNQWQRSVSQTYSASAALNQPLAENSYQMRIFSREVQQLSGVLREVGQSSNNVYSSLCSRWSGLSGWFRNYVSNQMIREANEVVGAIIQGINKNLCSTAAKSMGLNYTKLTMTKIPYLAKGAVLPANKPFLAVVGDQKNGTNVEAPLETIKQAVAEVMGNEGRDVVINFTGDLAQLARVLRPVIEKENARVGSRLITKGVM